MRFSMLLPVAVCAALPCAVLAASPYQISKDHTDVVFEINHVGFSMKHGSFREVSGTMQLDPQHLEASSVDVVVKADSVDTNHAVRDKELAGPGFFDALKFPDMHFVSTRVTRTGEQTLDVEGNLTLHGVTRPLVMHTKINKIGNSPFGNAPTIGITATAELKRSDFGIANMIPMLGDAVSITVDTEFSEAAK